MVCSRAVKAVIALATLLALVTPCVAQITDAEEVSIGRQMLQELAASGKVTVVHDEAAKVRLERVAERIVKSAGRPGLEWAGGWKWLLVEFESGPNAMAGPGGFVLVDNRLLDELASDDELAYVLAHEAGHVVGRHGFRELLERGRYTVPLLDADLELLRKLVTGELAYSRELETEADERALAIMERAGYDPKRAVQWYAALVYMNQDPAVLTLWERVFGTHPPLIDRASHLAEYYEKVISKGAFLAFVRDDTLWISKWDGTEQSKTSLSGEENVEVVWSDRGDTGVRMHKVERAIEGVVWSPRGDVIAVEWAGDIYLVDVGDLHVTRLTTSGKASQPVWAPGGNEIVCQSAGDIWVVSIDGREKRRLTTTKDCYSLAMSAAGTLVGYCRESGDESKGLWLAHWASGQSEQVASGSASHDQFYDEPQFSPQGTELSCAVYSGWKRVARGLCVVPIRGHRSPTYIPDATRSCWAPGGQQLLTWRGYERGSGLSSLNLGLGKFDTDIILRGMYVHSLKPDSCWRRLAILAGPTPYSAVEAAPDSALWIAQYPDLTCAQVDTGLHCVWDWPLAWLPDGSGVLLESTLVTDIRRSTIWSLSALDGSRRKVFSVGNGPTAFGAPWPYVL